MRRAARPCEVFAYITNYYKESGAMSTNVDRSQSDFRDQPNGPMQHQLMYNGYGNGNEYRFPPQNNEFVSGPVGQFQQVQNHMYDSTAIANSAMLNLAQYQYSSQHMGLPFEQQSSGQYMGLRQQQRVTQQQLLLPDANSSLSEGNLISCSSFQRTESDQPPLQQQPFATMIHTNTLSQPQVTNTLHQQPAVMSSSHMNQCATTATPRNTNKRGPGGRSSDFEDRHRSAKRPTIISNQTPRTSQNANGDVNVQRQIPQHNQQLAQRRLNFNAQDTSTSAMHNTQQQVSVAALRFASSRYPF
ncbi:unnamed protein product, partial [Didymodactylos carnosus]